jgi:hypothetical protein
LRIARGLRERGFDLGWDPSIARLAMEVYPHPAMLRWFGLERILKYKRGPVGDRRREFRRYQSLLGSCLALRFPELDPGPVGTMDVTREGRARCSGTTGTGSWCFRSEAPDRPPCPPPKIPAGRGSP